MSELEILKQRFEEVVDELCGYKWFGNEDEENYKMEYSIEYSHLLKERDEIDEQIWKLKHSNPTKNTITI